MLLLALLTASWPLVLSFSVHSHGSHHHGSHNHTTPEAYCGLVGYVVDSLSPFVNQSVSSDYECLALCYNTPGCESFAISQTECLLYSDRVLGHFKSDSGSQYRIFEKICFQGLSTAQTSTSTSILSIPIHILSTTQPEPTTTTTSTRTIINTVTFTRSTPTPTPVNFDDLVIRTSCNGSGLDGWISNALNEIGQFGLTDDPGSALRVSVDADPALAQRDLLIHNLVNHTDLTRVAGITALGSYSLGWASSQ
jgi:hypothetical protein